MVTGNGNGAAANGTAEPAESTAAGGGERNTDMVTAAATVGVIFVGAALIEVALIPGMIIGGAAILAPKYLPKVGAGLQPLVASTIRGAYKFGRKARETFAEAQEHVHDLVAEVHAEDQVPGAAPTGADASPHA